MKNVQPDYDLEFNYWRLCLHLIPVIGFFPSLWTLYRHNNIKAESADLTRLSPSREQLTTSRLSITLAGSWLGSYFLLGVGAEASELLTLRFLVLSSFLTSGYFLVSIWLIVRLLLHKPTYLPGFSNWARVLSKYLS